MKSTTVNLLLDTGDYSATSNTMKLVRWPLMGRLLLVQRGGYNKVDTKISMIYINDIYIYHDSIMIFSNKIIVIFLIFSKYQPLLLLMPKTSMEV